MLIETRQNAEETTIEVTGRIDAVTAPLLEKTVCDIVNTSKSLIFDFKEVEYISSAGLRVLLSSQKKMQQVGSMKVINVCNEVMEVFEITGFADILTLE